MKEANASRFNVGNAIRAQCVLHSDLLAFTFCSEISGHCDNLTFGDLDRHAMALSERLGENLNSGERILLCFSPGLEFIVAYCACLYAGLVAVPMYPPGRRRNETLARIASDARPSLILTTVNFVSLCTFGIPVDTVTLDIVPPDILFSRDVSISGEIAHIQYTSGSTGFPRGVMISHENILAEHAAASARYGVQNTDVMASWLPHFHDFGLIFTILRPLLSGITCHMMSPTAFVKDPHRWLKLISDTRATLSAAPNFGFYLCLKRIPADRLHELDLSAWRLVLNGGEPVKTETMNTFIEHMKPYGFTPETVRIGYGMAECTLVASTKIYMETPSFTELDAIGLQLGYAIPAQSGRPYRRITNCGKALDSLEIAIITDHGTLAENNKIGKIVVRGPSVTNRFSSPSDDACTLLPDPDGQNPWRLTGDQGFLCNGDVYTTARNSDLIRMGPVLLSPFGIEESFERNVEFIKPGHVAAFAASIGLHGEEFLIIAAEIDREKRNSPAPDFDALWQIIKEETAFEVAEFLIMIPGTLPKTTSGKVRRQECRSRFECGKLQKDALHTARIPKTKARRNVALRAHELLQKIENERHRYHIPESKISPHDPDSLLYISSLSIDIQESLFSRNIDLTRLLQESSSIVDLAIRASF